MKNIALISLSFLVLFGVSACSSSNQNINHAVNKNTDVLSKKSSSSMRPTSGKNASYTQNLIAEQKEQERLAYNYVWQQQQQLKRNKSNSTRNSAQARRNWQQQQAKLISQERSRLAQQKNKHRLARQANEQRNRQRLARQENEQRRNRQRLAQEHKNRQWTQNQNRLAKEYAAQQLKRQKQGQTHNRLAIEYAQRQMRKQAEAQANAKYAAQRKIQQRQQLASRQFNQAAKHAPQPYVQQQHRMKAQRQFVPQPRMQAQPQYVQPQPRMQAPRQYVQQQPQMQAPRQYVQPAPAQQSQRQQYLALLQQGNRNVPRTTPPRVTPQGGITELSQAEIRTIGDKIFRNESGGDVDKLVHWNVGENFASMGIGHFTWYPAGRRNRYGNTFPGLLDHLQSNGVQLPAWVQRAKHSGAPWRTKDELKSAKRSPQVREFQNLLYKTRYLQAGYIFKRAKRAMPRLVKATPQHLKGHVGQNLNAVANTPGGWYALIDYVNFKGEGLSRNGGYKGQNWGLLQVLENMRPSQPGPMALNNFADSAIQILERRIRNSNPSRGESRWMRGWAVRCNTYRQPFVI